MHGHAITKAIQRYSDDLLIVDHGSLYPALYRLEQKEWIAASWEPNPKGRPMKFYRLTDSGRQQLVAEQSKWEQLTRAIGMVLNRREA
jgi:PadR family transcriptional regulator PadR